MHGSIHGSPRPLFELIPATRNPTASAKWRFASAEHRDLFEADPEKYAPQYGGYCAWAVANNYTASIDHATQFDFIDGGGLDIACLGFAEADGTGNVNASKFAGRISGCGGFINISQNSKKVIFLGTFTSGGLETVIENGQLRIVNEGKHRKFVDTVGQITFSGSRAECRVSSAECRVSGVECRVLSGLRGGISQKK